eukprot:TRINITY_DN4775_c0_g1_i11.p1 TRINITY_DN4775_c0_g1~~TRINITY_DN4775_c0_g1_i11.p1  ORF type:complete len:104 (-),score=9.07 TRINITY_DN4775_c0_g1_i11:13-324(-)
MLIIQIKECLKVLEAIKEKVEPAESPAQRNAGNQAVTLSFRLSPHTFLCCTRIPLVEPESSTKLFSRYSTPHVLCVDTVSYTHLRAHETGRNLVCRLLLEKKK